MSCGCGVDQPDSGRDVDCNFPSRVKVFDYNQIVNDELALLLLGKGYRGIVFSYSGVPQEYLNCCDRHNLLWRKEKRGLSSVSVAEEGLDLVFKWFRSMWLRFELRNKHALVIGSRGFVGEEMCRIVEGVGMTLLEYDILDEQPDLFGLWLKEAELIFICTPEIGEPLLGKKEFVLMKNKPLIVNVSGRPSLVDDKVLHEFLDKGKVVGYTADHDEYHGQPLSAFSKCFYQTHQGAKSIEALEARFVEKEKNINELNASIIKRKK